MAVTATIEQLVDATYQTDPTARDASITMARTVVTAFIEENDLVEETDSERRKLYIAQAAVASLHNKHNSRSGNSDVITEFNKFIPDELRDLVNTSEDDEDTPSSIFVDTISR
jgi:hypothetical protein